MPPTYISLPLALSLSLSLLGARACTGRVFCFARQIVRANWGKSETSVYRSPATLPLRRSLPLASISRAMFEHRRARSDFIMRYGSLACSPASLDFIPYILASLVPASVYEILFLINVGRPKTFFKFMKVV